MILRPTHRWPAVRLALALALLSVGGAAHSASPRPVAVSIRMFAFSPQVVTVAPGTTVTWTNADDDPHTATSTDNSFHSKALDTGDSYSFTFAKPGEFAYFCALHPHMTGKVVVKAPN